MNKREIAQKIIDLMMEDEEMNEWIWNDIELDESGDVSEIDEERLNGRFYEMKMEIIKILAGG